MSRVISGEFRIAGSKPKIPPHRVFGSEGGI